MNNRKIKRLIVEGQLLVDDVADKINELIDEINEMKEFINNEKLK